MTKQKAIWVKVALRRGRSVWDLVEDARRQIDVALEGEGFGKQNEDNVHVLTLREFCAENGVLMIRYAVKEETREVWEARFGFRRPKVRFLKEEGAEMKADNPWLREMWWGQMVQSCTVEDRVHEMKSFGADKLKAVIAYEGTQTTVRKAAERRLRRLESV